MADLSKVLGGNFSRIRRSVGGTQEVFAEMMGLTQAQVSRLERGESFSRMRKLGDQLARAGANPMDLLHQAGPVDIRRAEVRKLLGEVDDETVQIVLQILRMNAAMKKQVAGA